MESTKRGPGRPRKSKAELRRNNALRQKRFRERRKAEWNQLKHELRPQIASTNDFMHFY